ncbi:MAG: hypothetical protein IJJ45_09940 [Clostridia bacterium]|nr:hypothetical protein [Clostridia bacterium]
MKKMLALLLAACLLFAGLSALAENDAAKDAAAAGVAADDGVQLFGELHFDLEEEAGDAAADAADEPDEGGALDADDDAGVAVTADDTEPEEAPEPDAEPEGETDREAGSEEAPEEEAEEAPEEEPEEEAEEGLEEELDESPLSEEAGSFRVWFEEGFGLELPAGWVSYPVSEAQRSEGLRYALGDGAGERFLYIECRKSGLSDIDALRDAVSQAEGLSIVDMPEFGGRPFVAFTDEARDVNGCATLWGGEVLSFLFTPGASDADAQAGELMDTFEISE